MVWPRVCHETSLLGAATSKTHMDEHGGHNKHALSVTVTQAKERDVLIPRKPSDSAGRIQWQLYGLKYATKRLY